jgi:hypothetical protein
MDPAVAVSRTLFACQRMAEKAEGREEKRRE